MRTSQVFAALLLCLVTSIADAANAPSRPNILWISTEDISPDVHCYGDAYAITPTIDKLASEGVMFERAFSTAPVCSPSRDSIITGMYASSVGGHNHRSDIVPAPDVRCFTEYLRQAGYYCTNNAKTDYNFPNPPSAWDASGPKAHWRHRPTKDTPFFAVFNTNTTHEGHAMDLNGNYTHVTDSLPVKHDPAKAVLPAYYPDTPAVRANWARYYDLITVMDGEVKDLLDQLEKDGLADNTIVFFWGDHGRCLPRGKRWAYDSGLRVPLIVRWPGHIEAGSKREDLVTLMDLGPTLISIAGGEVPKQMQGRVILGDHKDPEPKYVFATRDRMDEVYDMQRSARDRQYRYIKNFHPELPYAQHNKYMDHSPIMQEWRRLDAAGKLSGPSALFFAKTKPAEELYDLNTDPDEVHNLANDPTQHDRLVAMRTAVEDWMSQIHDLGMIPEEQLQKQMRPDGKKAKTAAPTVKVDGEVVHLTCNTPGSSIVWTTDDAGRYVHWQLYNPSTGVPVKPGLRAKACRLGYDDSPEVRIPS